MLGDLEKQLGSLKAASEPSKDELDRLKELGNMIVDEENEVIRLMQGSRQLKEKVIVLCDIFILAS